MNQSKESSVDAINPQHYKNGAIEAIDAIEAATIQKSGLEAVCVSHIIRYLWRYESKGGLTDVQKARWYCEKLIETMQGNQVYAPLHATKPVTGGMAETLRWVGIDLGSDLLKCVADDIETTRMLLQECAQVVPRALADRINEHLGSN